MTGTARKLHQRPAASGRPASAAALLAVLTGVPGVVVLYYVSLQPGGRARTTSAAAAEPS